MIYSEYQNIQIEGLACCVPKRTVKTTDYIDQFGLNRVEKFIEMTGVEERHIVSERQTSSDLAFEAARCLLKEKGIKPEQIGALIFVTETPDYDIPSSAFSLQKRLEIPTDCICFDINLGCSGFTSGFNTISAIMTASNIERGLLLFGDTLTKKISPEDHSVCMMLGDAGGALLLKKDSSSEKIYTCSRSLGNKFEMVSIPAGRNRYPDLPHTAKVQEDGNVRSAYNFYMDGASVYFFATTDVSKGVREYLDTYQFDESDYDGLFLHQANKMIMERFVKRVKFPAEKVPVEISKFGNTGIASIPMAIVGKYANTASQSIRLLMCGFGTGLSWALVDAHLDTADIMPLIVSDYHYDDQLDLFWRE